MDARSLRVVRVLGAVAAAGLLAGVFAAYLDPHTVVDLSNWVWSCLQ